MPLVSSHSPNETRSCGRSKALASQARLPLRPPLFGCTYTFAHKCSGAPTKNKLIYKARVVYSQLSERGEGSRRTRPRKQSTRTGPPTAKVAQKPPCLRSPRCLATRTPRLFLIRRRRPTRLAPTQQREEGRNRLHTRVAKTFGHASWKCARFVSCPPR